jgi:hypothetical protein
MTGFNQMGKDIELTRNVSMVGVFVCVCGYFNS